jgi:iron complex transport system substrate-binding protein
MRVTSRPTPSETTTEGLFHDRRTRRATAVLGLLLAVVLGCQTSGGSTPSPLATPLPSPSATPSPAPTPTPQPSPSPSPVAAFPRTIVDDEGTSLTLDSEPQTIVSLTPANTEIAYALGAGDRMRGGTDYDNFPPEAAALPDVVAGVQVLTEKIVDIDPDLVLAGGNNFTPAAEIERMRNLGINVLVVYPPTVDDVLADIELIGSAIGADDAAHEITDGMRARIDEVTAAIEGVDVPRTFYEIGNVPEIFGPAKDSFVADMVELAGGDAITTDDPAVYSISLEQLVAQDPEVIVLGDAAYGVCPQELATRPGWAGITAVRDGQVRPVDDIVVTRPGPRLAEGLAALALAIHPDADIVPSDEATTYCQGPD